MADWAWAARWGADPITTEPAAIVTDTQVASSTNDWRSHACSACGVVAVLGVAAASIFLLAATVYQLAQEFAQVAGAQIAGF
jgi:anti-sigma-K factor RskA